MSLIAWYPLNGDLNDYSGNNLTAATRAGGATTNTSGKIGSCYYFDGVNSFLSMPTMSQVTGNKPFTLTAWIKTSGLGASMTQGGILAPSYGLVMLVNSSGNLVMYLDNGTGINAYTDTSINLFDNIWHHCAASWSSDGILRMYIDGSLVKTSTGVIYNSRYSSPSRIGDNPNNTMYKFYGYINDARIYDTALSDKEVKEIAKAKILHYPFNEQKETSTNLLNGNDLIFSGSGWIVYSGATVSLTQNISVPEWNTTKATKIDIAGGTNTLCYIHQGVAPAPSGVSYSAQIRIKNTGATTVRFGTQYGYIQSISPGDSAYLSNSITGNGSSNFQLRFETVNIGDSVSFLAYQPQIEQRPAPTAYINGGTRTDIITDNSGYKVDSTLGASCPSWGTTYSKVGTGGYAFYSGASMYSVIPNGQCKVTDQITVSAWAYRSNWSDATSERILSCTETGGWNLAINDIAGTLHFQIYVNGTYGPAGYSLSNISSGWHLVTGTYDGRYVKLYLDGSLVSTADRGATYPITYNATNGIFIGAEAGGNTTTPAGNYWNGYIDDVRIYATALSASDILDLYNTRGSIDNQGTFYANELVQYTGFDDYYNANNLVLNGSAELGNNTNFTGVSYYSSDGYDSLGCFQKSSNYTLLTNDYIPVNYFDTYRLSGWFKSTGATYSALYFGVSCYDKNKAWIEYKMVNHYTNTRTTLAATLYPGATIAYLTSGTNWTAGTSGTYVYTKQVAFWPTDTREYPPYTYTRTTAQYITLNTNEIWLNGAWTGATIPMGSETANCYDGGNYNYIAAGNVSVPSTWTNYTATITSWAINNNNLFRYGTQYVKILGLLNYQQGSTYTLLFDRIQFLNTTSYQTLAGSTQGVQSTGIFKTMDINELGITNGLITYLPFNGDANDIVSNKSSTVTGATLVDGIFGQAYGFTTGNLISCTNGASGISTDQKFSMGAWIYKTANSPDPYGRILIDSNDAIELTVNSTNQQIIATLQYSSGLYLATGSSTTTATNTWYHVFITYDGVLLKLYINGILESSKRITGFITAGSTLYIGNWSSLAQSFLGKIEDVRVYNRDLTAQEVGILYDMTKPSANAMKITNDTVYLKGEIKEVV